MKTETKKQEGISGIYNIQIKYTVCTSLFS